MKVVVTGASGRIGAYATRELLQAGHEVICVDVASLRSIPCPVLRADLTDAGQVYGALAGADAVVHMGAWANAGMVPNTRTYADNTSGTYNVLQACADLGIRRVVCASSAQVYGFAGHAPVFVPADESHPLRPLNCYALSKMAGEQAVDYFRCRYGLEAVSFRIMGARAPAEMDANVERIAADPSADTGLLWTRVDARDVARAARLALEAPALEPGPYNITGARVVIDQDSAALVRAHCGPEVEVRPGLDGRASPLTCARAERVFGYRPRYIWTLDQRHPET